MEECMQFEEHEGWLYGLEGIMLPRRSLVEDVSSNEQMRSRANIQARCERLTPRERQVLQLVAAGKTTKEIAAKLRLSARTIDAHRAHIAMKTGAKSLAELRKMAILLSSSHRSAAKSGERIR